jgi:hypothetical protein
MIAFAALQRSKNAIEACFGEALHVPRNFRAKIKHRSCWKLQHTQYGSQIGIIVGSDSQLELCLCLSSILWEIPFSWGIRLALSLRPIEKTHVRHGANRWCLQSIWSYGTRNVIEVIEWWFWELPTDCPVLCLFFLSSILRGIPFSSGIRLALPFLPMSCF